MIEVRIIPFVMQPSDGYEPGIKSTEALVASMLMDGYEIKSFQFTQPDHELAGTGVFVMVRDVEPVVEAEDDSKHYRDLCVLFELLRKDDVIGAIEPGYLWQLQLSVVDIARWLIAHGADNGSEFADIIKGYIATYEALGYKKSIANVDTLWNRAERIHAEYIAAQKDGE